MDTLSYSDARGNFRKTMDKVCEDHAPVVVTRQNKPAVVMIALEDYNAIEATLHLMRHPKNAQRLLKAVRNVEQGKYRKRPLTDA
jgi:antitoxin YefM